MPSRRTRSGLARQQPEKDEADCPLKGPGEAFRKEHEGWTGGVGIPDGLGRVTVGPQGADEHDDGSRGIGSVLLAELGEDLAKCGGESDQNLVAAALVPRDHLRGNAVLKDAYLGAEQITQHRVRLEGDRQC